MTTIKCLTWNIRGLNNHKKARMVASTLRRLQIDMCCLQETHLSNAQDPKLFPRSWGEVHASSYSQHARGVAILIKRGIGWHTLQTTIDPEGRYVILYGQLATTYMVLVATYGPNIDDPAFFHRLWAKIVTLGCDTILWGGDYNVLHERMDRDSVHPNPHRRATQTLNTIIQDSHLTDACRYFHPLLREGTCVSAFHNSWSRLDYWLVSSDAISWATECRHLSRTLSDHAPVILVWTVPDTKPRAFTWRLPLYALMDSAFAADIAAEIDSYFQLNEGTVESSSTLWEAFKVVIRGSCISKQSGVLKSIRITLTSLEHDLKLLETQYF